jgi:hypothetical protein
MGTKQTLDLRLWVLEMWGRASIASGNKISKLKKEENIRNINTNN